MAIRIRHTYAGFSDEANVIWNQLLEWKNACLDSPDNPPRRPDELFARLAELTS